MALNISPLIILNSQVRLHLLSNVYSPPSDYDFSKEVKPGKRKFRMAWITEGNYPWLVYSALLKGAFCLFCVLFPQSIANGYPGAFIVSPFTKYKDFHSHALRTSPFQKFLAAPMFTKIYFCLAYIGCQIKFTRPHPRQKIYVV